MKLSKAQLERIASLEDARGRLTAPALVEDAKRKTSPLHTLFDWNIKRAAEKHWLHQAREIIGAVTIQVTLQHSVAKAPMYVRDGTQTSGYLSVVRMRDDRTMSLESVRLALTTAAGHLERAYSMAGPLGLAEDIDRLLKEITGLVRTMETQAA